MSSTQDKLTGKKSVVTRQALDGALKKVHTVLQSLKEDVEDIGECAKEHIWLNINYDSSTGKLDAESSTDVLFSKLQLHNHVGASIIDSATGNQSVDIFGVVVSVEQYSKLIVFDLGYDISSTPALALVRCNDDNTYSCTLLKEQKDSGSEHNKWKGCRLAYIEGSEEYTVDLQRDSDVVLSKVKIGDTVSFDVRWSGGIVMAALTGTVTTLSKSLSYSGQEVSGFTVAIDPFYGTDWKYRTLKIRYDGTWSVLYHQ